MKEFSSISRCLLIVATAILFPIVCAGISGAGTKVFSGASTSITFDKSCKDTSVKVEMTLVLEDASEGRSSGWFYGKGTSPAELRSITPSHYEVNYPEASYYKLPASHMELIPVGGGYRAVIRDHIPEDKELRESACYFEKMEVTLTPLDEATDSIKTRARDLFSAEYMTTEAFELVFNKREYRAAEVLGYKALPILEQLYGKLSKEALNADAIIAFALMGLERFDEALKILDPYHAAQPDNKSLKEFEELLQKAKKEQDDLFRYDPDSKDDVILDPLG